MADKVKFLEHLDTLREKLDQFGLFQLMVEHNKSPEIVLACICAMIGEGFLCMSVLVDENPPGIGRGIDGIAKIMIEKFRIELMHKHIRELEKVTGDGHEKLKAMLKLLGEN